MSFNRSGYIGRAPGDSSIVLAKQYFQPTGAGKTFTFTAGYDPGLLDVYRNGVKLINVLDYAATDGSTIVLDTPVGVGSTVQVVAYKGFNLAEVNSSGADFNVGTNLYVQSGFGSFSQGITANQIDVSGIGTIGIGSFVDVNISGAATVAGTLVANSFSGDGSALTGLANTAYIVSVATTSGNLNVSAAATITGDLTVSDSIAVTKDLNVGAATTITGILKCTSTTPSTSTSTGGVVISGGLGVGADVYIGAGLSVAGTLTYEDVTSVDSVGMVTAKSGVNVSGGQLQVGVAYSVGAAGVATAAGFVGPLTGDVTGDLTGTVNTAAQTSITSLGTLTGLTVSGDATLTGASYSVVWDKSDNALEFGDNAKIKVGSGDDLNIYHDGNSYISNAVANQLAIQSDDLKLRSYTGTEKYLTGAVNGAVEIYYNDSKKFETTNDGTVTTGIGTFSNGIVIPDDKIAKFGTGEDLQIYHTTSDNDGYIKYQNENGHLRILSGVSGNGGIKLNNRTDNAAYIHCDSEGAVKSYYNNSLRLSTTNEGVLVSGMTSATAGIAVTGGFIEGAFIKAGKLSDNQTLGISTSNVFYFTTAETTTATPNIVWNDTYSLSSKMNVGDMITVNVITTAAAAGYAANWTIDGNAVTEVWVGGAAPSAGGSSGLDIYALTILKTGTGTGDSGFKVIANVTNGA